MSSPTIPVTVVAAPTTPLVLVIVFSLISTLIGASLPIQSGSSRIVTAITGNPFIATVLSFLAGSTILFVVNTLLLLTSVLPRKEKISTEAMKTKFSPWEFLGGVLGSTSLTLRVIFTPLIGFTLTNVMAVLGQLACSLFVDHIGFQGLPQRKVTKIRFSGMLLIIIGCIVSNFDAMTSGTKIESIPLFILYCLGMFCSGAMLPAQAAGNRKLSMRFNSRIPLSAAFISFAIGFLSLTTITIILQSAHAIAEIKPVEYIKQNWELVAFLPGPIGSFYVGGAVIFVRKLGVSIFFVCVIAGSIVMSLILDEVGAFGLPASPTTVLRAIGAAVTFLGATVVVFSDKIQMELSTFSGRFQRFKDVEESNETIGAGDVEMR